MNWLNFFYNKTTQLRHSFGRGINASISPDEEELFNKSYEAFEKKDILKAYEYFFKSLENFSTDIKDILIRAGGIEDKNYLKSAYLDKIEIVRVDENSDNDIVIDFNYHDLISTNKYEKFKLQKDDQIIVRKNIYYQKNQTNTLAGP